MKNKLLHTALLLLSAVSILISCKKETVKGIDNPDVESATIDSTLKSFYPKPNISATFEGIYSYAFPNAVNGFAINLYWYDPAATHGIYLHFNNNIGDVLVDNDGFILGFDSGIQIDSTTAGKWSNGADGIFSFDYVVNPSTNKGNLAGKGDKYILFRAYSDSAPQEKYYGWVRVTVSANGRNLEIHAIGYQKNPNTALLTGEI